MASGWSWDPATVLQNFNSSSAGGRVNATKPLTPRDLNVPPPPPSSNETNAAVKAIDTPVQDPPSSVSAAPAANKPASAPRKRKSEAVTEPESLSEIDDDDPRLEHVDQTCQQVRTKIKRFIESGEMKVGEFRAAAGIGAAGYSRFMNQSGRDAGAGSDVYYNAWKFFKKRELKSPKTTASKKAKTSGKATGKAADALDVDAVALDVDDQGKVPVYDTCDEVRKKIRAILRKDGVTQAAFVRAIAKCFPEERKVQPAQLSTFLGKNGPMDGNTSCVFYGSYVFFEKLRLKEGKPKSAMRLEMEELYGKEGVNTVESQNRPLWLGPGERAHQDKYGKTHIISKGGRKKTL